MKLYASALELRSCYIFAGAIVLVWALSGGLPVQGVAQGDITYYQHIKPILERNCVACHRPGEAAPFALTTYEDVAKRAEFIQWVTESRYMPPWMADPSFRTFANQRLLTQGQIDTIAAWVRGGQKKGKPAPAAQQTAPETWPEPDLTLSMKPFMLPGDGTEQFRIFIIPTQLEEERYLRGIDFQPGNLRAAHHARLMVDTSQLLRPDDGTRAGDPNTEFTRRNVRLADYFLYGWVPGNFPVFYPEGIGKRLPAGADLVLNMHYSPTARPEQDQSRIRLYFAPEKPRRLVKTFILDENWVVNQPFVIPADTVIRFTMRSPLIPADISLLSVMPHMHLLGRSFKAWAVTPQGDVLLLIKIDDWNFNWQMTYQFEHPLKLPKGSVIFAEAVYDNTSRNPRNPFHPPQTATYGWGTTNEMMNLIFEYLDYEPGDETLRMPGYAR